MLVLPRFQHTTTNITAVNFSGIKNGSNLMTRIKNTGFFDPSLI